MVDEAVSSSFQRGGQVRTVSSPAGDSFWNGWASLPVRPSTQSSMATPPRLYKLLCRFRNLEEAWRQVRSHALQSQSPEIRKESQLFEESATSKLRSVQSRLAQGRFKFEPARGIAIRRKGKKPRPVVVAPIESRIVQRALLNVLQKFPKSSTSYKPATTMVGFRVADLEYLPQSQKHFSLFNHLDTT